MKMSDTLPAARSWRDSRLLAACEFAVVAAVFMADVRHHIWHGPRCGCEELISQGRATSLAPDVDHLLHLGNDLAGFIFHLDQKCGLIFLLRRELGANLVELRIAQPELGLELSLPGFTESDARSLVPYDVIAAKVLHQHQHVEGIGHGVERATVVRADVIPVPRAQLQLHIDVAVGTPAHADSSAEKRRPDVDPAQHQFLDFSVHVQRSPARCQTRRMRSAFNVSDYWAGRSKARRALDCMTARRLPTWR